MQLAIRIGSAGVDFAVGLSDGALVETHKSTSDPQQHALTVLEEIERTATVLKEKYQLQRVAFAFAGSADSEKGRLVRGRQFHGLDDFPLADWSQKILKLPASVHNDTQLAALAEAQRGGGRDRHVVLYVSVGHSLDAALTLGGQLYPQRPEVSACELGQMRPGLSADRAEETLDAIASGWGIAAAGQLRLSDPISHPLKPLQQHIRSLNPDDVRQRLIEVEQVEEEFAGDLLNRCDGRADALTAKLIAQAAAEGNEIAREILAHACQALGWGIAQAITLFAPEVVIVGGGVSLSGEALFLGPLRQQVDRYVFPRLHGTFEIRPAEFADDGAVRGALIWRP
jgi:glucokinase